MHHVEMNELLHFLSRVSGGPVRLLKSARLGGEHTGDLKGFGYGEPLELVWETVPPAPHRQFHAVLETMRPGPHGHEHWADRAQALLWAHGSSNTLPRHVSSLATGAITRDGKIVDLSAAEEAFILTSFAAGNEYASDLQRLRDGGAACDLDFERARALAHYLAGIHAAKLAHPSLYTRRIRDTLGHGECIMGILDSYPENHPWITPTLLQRIEESLVPWRWRLKNHAHRLSRVHGDFHPWNVLFRENCDFSVLDCSRGEWGEPADDVICMALNYVFFALQSTGTSRQTLWKLFREFWATYSRESLDSDLGAHCAPFAVFRALVMASPVWYPHLDDGIRRQLFHLIDHVLGAPRFDPDDIAANFA